MIVCVRLNDSLRVTSRSQPPSPQICAISVIHQTFSKRDSQNGQQTMTLFVDQILCFTRNNNNNNPVTKTKV